MTDPSKVIENWLLQVGRSSFSYSDRPDNQADSIKKFNSVKLDLTMEKLIEDIYKWCNGERKKKPRFSDVIICLSQYVVRNNNYCNKLVPHVPSLEDLNYVWDKKSRIAVTKGDPETYMGVSRQTINKWYDVYKKLDVDFGQLADEVITDCVVAPSTLKFAKAAALMVVLNERRNVATTTTVSQ